jgi:hypothetical protein
MQISYKLTYSDYKDALRLHYSKSGKWTSPMNLFSFMFGIGCLLTVCALVEYFHDKDNFLASNQLSLVCVILFFLLFPVFYSFALKKQFKGSFPHGGTDRQLTIDIDDERIIAETPGLSESKILWQAIDRFTQNEKVTMLYIAKLRFIYFPTRSLSDVQRTELNMLVARHGVKR